MIDVNSMLLFIPTFFAISITPGMCMTLALTMGMTVGIRKTLWMSLGELIGVGSVAVCAVVGVAAIVVQFPSLFYVLKYAGGAYLIYVGIQMWQAKSKLSFGSDDQQQFDKSGLEIALQGFITAIANPKGWAFMISMLPPFVHPNLPFTPQLTALLVIIITIEFFCLMVYANGGKQLARLLQRSDNVALMNRVSGSLMMLVGLWLALS